MRITTIPSILGLCALLVACTEKTLEEVVKPCCAEDEVPAATPLPDTSIYQLDSEWLDQTGASRRLAEFRGKTQVVAMIFTTCEYACPRIMADLQSIEAALSPGDLSTTQFLLISFDSERDTPAVLSTYAADHGLAKDRWTLLTGKPADVREVAATLGVRYKASPKVGFSHSNLITILGPKGTIRFQQTGLGAEVAPTLAKIRAVESSRQAR